MTIDFDWKLTREGQVTAEIVQRAKFCMEQGWYLPAINDVTDAFRTGNPIWRPYVDMGLPRLSSEKEGRLALRKFMTSLVSFSMTSVAPDIMRHWFEGLPRDKRTDWFCAINAAAHNKNTFGLFALKRAAKEYADPGCHWLIKTGDEVGIDWLRAGRNQDLLLELLEEDLSPSLLIPALTCLSNRGAQFQRAHAQMLYKQHSDWPQKAVSVAEIFSLDLSVLRDWFPAEHADGPGTEELDAVQAAIAARREVGEATSAKDLKPL